MSANAFNLLDYLFERPLIHVTAASRYLNISFPAANGMIADLVTMGVLVEVTGGRRNRLFRFDPYLKLFENAAADERPGNVVAAQPTRY